MPTPAPRAASVTLGQIVNVLGGTLHGGAPNCIITQIAALEQADEHSISFLSNPRYIGQLAHSRAACVIVAENMREAALKRGACIVADNPYLYFARLTQWWKRQQPKFNWANAGQHIHPSAVIHPSAKIASDAHIGPLCVIEANTYIGSGSVLVACVHVGENCHIGSQCLLHPGVVIGADGFGFARNGAVGWEKIEQLGRVVIGDNVEIGANTCIDRGALDDTEIGNGVKIDNLVQIAHNVQIGPRTVIAANTGIAGSARIGADCSIGGAANILGHLEIAPGTSISPTSMVTRSLHKPELYTGIFPLQTNAQWEKNAAAFKQLAHLRERLRKLEQSLQDITLQNGKS